MKVFSAVPQFDPLLITRLLRKNFVDKAVLCLKIILVLLAIYLLYALGVEVIATRTKLSTSVLMLRNREAPPPVSARAAPPGGRDYAVIYKRSLIGALEDTSKAQTPQTPISNIPMGLIGVYIEDKNDPYAIIEDKKKNLQDVFMLDDMVFGEAKLKKILSDRVEIERNGQIEQLIIEDQPSKGGDGKGGTISSEGNTFTIAEAEIDKALENLPLLLTQARAVPYFKDGVSVGLRLFAIKSDSIFEKLGFKNGDILKAINGNSLGDLTQAMKLFETLKQERNLSIKLERAAEEKDYRYEIR